MTKEFLSQKGVPYTEKDVARDQAAARELVNMGQRGVPVILVDGQMVVGFDRPRLEQLLARGKAAPAHSPPRLGASVTDAQRAGPPGAYVGRVHPGSAAAAAGIRPGDIITSLAGQPIRAAADIELVLRRLQPAQQVAVHVQRQGEPQTLVLTLR